MSHLQHEVLEDKLPLKRHSLSCEIQCRQWGGGSIAAVDQVAEMKKISEVFGQLEYIYAKISGAVCSWNFSCTHRLSNVSADTPLCRAISAMLAANVLSRG